MTASEFTPIRPRAANVLRTGEALALHGRARVRAQLAAQRWQRPVRAVVVTHNGPRNDISRRCAAALRAARSPG